MLIGPHALLPCTKACLSARENTPEPLLLLHASLGAMGLLQHVAHWSYTPRRCLSDYVHPYTMVQL